MTSEIETLKKTVSSQSKKITELMNENKKLRKLLLDITNMYKRETKEN